MIVGTLYEVIRSAPAWLRLLREEVLFEEVLDGITLLYQGVMPYNFGDFYVVEAECLGLECERVFVRVFIPQGQTPAKDAVQKALKVFLLACGDVPHW